MTARTIHARKGDVAAFVLMASLFALCVIELWRTI